MRERNADKEKEGREKGLIIRVASEPIVNSTPVSLAMSGAQDSVAMQSPRAPGAPSDFSLLIIVIPGKEHLRPGGDLAITARTDSW